MRDGERFSAGLIFKWSEQNSFSFLFQPVSSIEFYFFYDFYALVSNQICTNLSRFERHYDRSAIPTSDAIVYANGLMISHLEGHVYDNCKCYGFLYSSILVSITILYTMSVNSREKQSQRDFIKREIIQVFACFFRCINI